MFLTVRRAVVATFATALLLTGVVLLAPAASAHDVLVSTTPAQGSRTSRAPGQVVLTFDKPALALGTEIRVTGPDGITVSAGRPRLVDSDVTQDLAGALPAGSYLVTWRVTSADGHPVSGRFGFTTTGAGQGAVASLPPTPVRSSASEQASSGAGSLGPLMVIVGAVLIAVVAAAVAGRAIRGRAGDAR